MSLAAELSDALSFVGCPSFRFLNERDHGNFSSIFNFAD